MLETDAMCRCRGSRFQMSCVRRGHFVRLEKFQVNVCSGQGVLVAGCGLEGWCLECMLRLLVVTIMMELGF